jgi:hypothetical protein
MAPESRMLTRLVPSNSLPPLATPNTASSNPSAAISARSTYTSRESSAARYARSRDAASLVCGMTSGPGAATRSDAPLLNSDRVGFFSGSTA